MPLDWTHAVRTDLGRVRETNEDAWLADPRIGAFGVADGMGGHAAGEVAAGIAADTLLETLRRLPPDARAEAARQALVEGITRANERILAEAEREPGRAGMGTTVTVLVLLAEGRWALGHVGDSRAYLLRNGTLRRLTEDHTWVQGLVEKGRLSDEQARLHPRSSLLTRALGTEARVSVDIQDGELAPGDRFLLCSDGLTGMVPETRLSEIAREEDDVESLSERLLSAALEAGGTDNVTVLVVSVQGDQ